MADVLGIDTSNYTTSCAVLDTDSMTIVQKKRLLPVKSGERGIRQSDAVFHHTRQLPELIAEAVSGRKLEAIGVSVKPRLIEGSYMPCFLVGEGTADSIGSVINIAPDKTSHQMGHILAALYSAGRLELLHGDKPFLAFHVSGGTTEMLLCTPDKDEIVRCECVGQSLDLKAGQLIDRTGVRLGLDFPCGIELERLALQSSAEFNIKPVMKGLDCCLSGFENRCEKLIEEGSPRCDTARYCLLAVYSTIDAMTQAAIDKFGSMEIIYAGGVMSDRLIAERLAKRPGTFFAAPEFSSDNAAGTALFSAFKKGLIR